MKKVLFLMITALLALALTACAGNSAPTKPAVTEAPTEAKYIDTQLNEPEWTLAEGTLQLLDGNNTVLASGKDEILYFAIVTNKDGTQRSAQCIHGGAAFVWPVFQAYEYLDLTPMSIPVDLTNALSHQNIRVDVPSRFTVGISTDVGIMQNAAERLLGLKLVDIQELAKDFTDIHSTYICKDLLGTLGKSTSPVSDPRTAEYYKVRPCVKLVRSAAQIVEEKLLAEEINRTE